MKLPLTKPSANSALKMTNLAMGVLAGAIFATICWVALKYEPPTDDEVAGASDRGPNPAVAPGGAGGPGGPGGPGGRPGRSREPVKVLAQFDADRNGWLNATERTAALAHLETQPATSGRGGRGGPGGFRRGGPGGGGDQSEPEPGPQLTPGDVESLPDAPLYDPFSLRTLFLEFESDDWEKQLEAFRYTDVDVPATLEVDGETMEQVGVRFRGNTSYSTISTGRKRPLNLTLDLVHPKQDIDGYGTLNLLNANGDPTMLRSILYYEIAREYIPSFQANFVRVVINGESWGVYANVQQFDSNFTEDFFGTPKGARWKIPGSPAGQGGLNYLGDDIAPYRQIFELKSKEDPKSWVNLMLLSQVLNETPIELLESALDPILDVDGVLRFLALDNVFVNNDGFWVRASDYSLYQDTHGKFHILPYDANETFATGRGRGGPPGGAAAGGARGRVGQAGRLAPGEILAPAFLAEADENADGESGRGEFVSLADRWFSDAAVDIADPLDRDQFVAGLTTWVNRQSGAGGGGRAGFSPASFLSAALFSAIDTDQDGQIAHVDLRNQLDAWFTEWDLLQFGYLTASEFAEGINGTMERLRAQAGGGAGQAGVRRGGGNTGGFGGRRAGGAGGPGGRPGGGGGGVDLNPLVLENDEARPLASRLLAVPELRARYLSYVRDIAENWLDWEKMGARVLQYQALIEDDMKTDTRKLATTEAFFAGVDDGGGEESNSLRGFFERRQAFLLNHEEVKSAQSLTP